MVLCLSNILTFSTFTFAEKNFPEIAYWTQRLDQSWTTSLNSLVGFSFFVWWSCLVSHHHLGFSIKMEFVLWNPFFFPLSIGKELFESRDSTPLKAPKSSNFALTVVHSVQHAFNGTNGYFCKRTYLLASAAIPRSSICWRCYCEYFSSVEHNVISEKYCSKILRRRICTQGFKTHPIIAADYGLAAWYTVKRLFDPVYLLSSPFFLKTSISCFWSYI